MKKLPSLHQPVLAVAGVLAGLGLWYLLALMDVLWVMVVIGIVLLLVLEMVTRLSRALLARIGARGNDTAPHMPHLHGRERYIALAGLIVGLACGYALWGPVLILNQGGSA
ncbi:hypothetical protein [Thioclava indica]|uniref:Uncharacterized protein n=1 Tax=Thioclava indica TaxID=1353528 RepID=A0A074JCB0_9RHOB|nr:hypothetical protein [Thioclava indica]KEO53480.1 hypothetical protein DT23_18440 [Thioclava indica]